VPEKWDDNLPLLFSIQQCFSTAGPRPLYRALASITPGRERFSWNLSF